MLLVTERPRLRLTVVLVSALVLLLLCARLAGLNNTETLLGLQYDWIGSSSSKSSQTTLDGSVIRPPGSGSNLIGSYGEITGFAPPTTLRPGFIHPLHTVLFSATTRDRQYFPIHFGLERTLNPNIIPHPEIDDTWIIVAQRHIDHVPDVVQPSFELVCNATFIDDQLVCIEDAGRTIGGPQVLPISPTVGDKSKCTGAINYFSLNVGPHDARVFYGPEHPYALYGSNSEFTCFGQWIQDFRGLVPDWGPQYRNTSQAVDTTLGEGLVLSNGIEIQRPRRYAPIEKNWFLFWDAAGDAYVHFDITPSRSFARLNADGSVGKDLALRSGKKDNACLARYLPRLTNPDYESVHQATNSLSVTLCRRSDPECQPNDDNTFIFIIFHHKTYFNFHAAYHPYVMVFRRSAPFEVWAVGMHALWISGRNTLPEGDTEMFFVTSISWRDKGHRYHGYADDVVFLAFGIEDKESAGIDVLAGDLLANLGLC